jgi:hypothetical protein
MLHLPPLFSIHYSAFAPLTPLATFAPSPIDIHAAQNSKNAALMLNVPT